MLIEKVRDVYRELIKPVVTPESITKIPATRPAANSHRYADSDGLRRRQRRQRRLNRAAVNRIHGWAVRTW